MTTASGRAKKLRSVVSSVFKKSKIRAGGSTIFSVFFVFSLAALSIFVRSNVSALSGVGNAADPYLITSCQDLQDINTISDTGNAVFKLVSDIDCSATSTWNSGAGFAPIENFYGTLDGDNHTISGLYINRPSEDQVGLFSNLSHGYIINVGMDSSSNIIGANEVGSISGHAYASDIIGIQSAATVVSSGDAGGLIGGIGGWQNDMVVSRSNFSGMVTANGAGHRVGGIVGVANNGWTIRDVASYATVQGAITGGVVGEGYGSCGYRYISNTYSVGTVSGSEFTGGIVGRYNEQTCYENYIHDSISFATLGGSGTKGGVVGSQYNSALDINNTYFYDTSAGTTDCIGTSTNGTGNVSCGLVSSAPVNEPYAQWDFESVWESGEGQFLRLPVTGVGEPSVVTSIGTVTPYQEANDVQISWVASQDLGGLPLEQYRVEIKTSNDEWSNLTDYTTTTSPDASFGSLSLGTQYNVRVRAETEYGPSQWVEYTFSTNPPAVHEISNCEELVAADDDIDTWLDTFVLTADIDCAGQGEMEPLRWDGTFSGIFDGQGHTINAADITSEDWSTGLIGWAEGAKIKNLILTNGSVNSAFGSIGSAVGGASNTTIENIFSDWYISGGESQVGGIVGYAEYYNRDETLRGLKFEGIVSGAYEVGGIFGKLEVYDPGVDVTLQKSYNTGSVTATGYNSAGGLIGYAYVENDEGDGELAASLTVKNSYSNASVQAVDSTGGLIGFADVYNDGYDSLTKISIDRSYSAGMVEATEYNAGGLVGHTDLDGDFLELSITNSFTAAHVSSTDESYSWAIVGGQGYIGDGELTLVNNVFDGYSTGQDYPAYPEIDGWTRINDEGPESSYFYNNVENAPLDTWDFDQIWVSQEATYPTFREDTDYNGDETPDADQPNVAGYTSPFTGKIVAFDVGEGCEVTTDDIVEESSLVTADPNYEYENGLFDFAADCQIPGQTTTIKLYYYGVSKDGMYLRKYNPHTQAYADVAGANISEETINGSIVTVVTYQITDGGALDMDGEVNGSIEDPAGIGVKVAGSGSANNSGLAGTGDNTMVIVLGATLLIITTLIFTFKDSAAEVAVKVKSKQ